MKTEKEIIIEISIELGKIYGTVGRSENYGIAKGLAEIVLNNAVNGKEAELCSKIYDQRKEIELLKKQKNDWIVAFGNFCEVINNQIEKKKSNEKLPTHF